MLNVTNSAMEMCHATIIQLSNAQIHSKCLRFDQAPDKQIMLHFDIPEKSDEIIEHKGVPVIAIPKKFTAFCANKTLDVGDHGKLTLS